MSSANASQYIGSVEVEVLTNPGVPGAISLAASDGDGSYSISWGVASGVVDRYELQERKEGGSWSRVYNGASRTRNIGGKSTGVYEYRVRACNDSAYSSKVSCYNYTSIKKITVIKAPSSINVPVNSKNGSISISWGSVSGASSYKVQEQKNSGSWTDIYNGSAKSKTISGRGTGTYKYRVAAVISGKVGGYRTSSSVIVSRTPGIPGGLSAPSTANSGSYTVTWNSVSGATNYNLVEGGSGTGNWSQSTTSKSINKSNDGSYTYKVRACKVYSGVTACSGWTSSKTVSVSLPKITGPTSSNTGEYKLNYAKTTGSDAELRVYKGGSLIGDPEVNTSGGTFSVGGADTGTWNYKLYSGEKCRQYNAQGNCTEPGAMALKGEHTVLVDIPTAGAISLASADKDGNYSISWGAASGTPSRYELQERKDSGAWSSDIHGDSARSKNVSSKTTGDYSYRVRACFSGCSLYSAEKSITVVRTPTAINTPASSTNGSVAISWSTVSGADSYQLQEQKNDGGWSDIYNGTDKNITVTGRGTGTYKYRIAAVENGVVGNFHTSGNVIVSRAPAVPTGLSVPGNSINGIYNVSWSAVAGADNYRLEESGASSRSWLQSAVNRTFTKINNGSYSYRLQSCSTYSGVTSCSAWTSAATINVDLPDFFAQSVDSGDVQLVWSEWPVDKVALRRGSETIYESSWGYSGQARTFTDTLSASGNYSYTLVGWKCLPGSVDGSCIKEPQGSRGPVTVDVVIKPSIPVLTIDTGNDTNTSYSGMLTATSDSTGPIERVQWQVRAVGDGWPPDIQYDSTATFTLSGLSDGNYQLRSKNCNSDGCSDNWSSSVTFEIWKIDPPSRPEISPISNSIDGIIRIDWQDLTGQFAHKYEIYENGAHSPIVTLKSTSNNKKAPNTPHSYESDKLSDGDYSYAVIACNPAGCSSPSASRSFIVAHKPAGLSAPFHSDKSNGAVYVQWNSVPGSDIYYELRQRLVGGAWFESDTDTIKTNEAVVRGLAEGGWEFSVRACNKYAWSCGSFSPASSAVTVIPAPNWANADYVPADNSYSPADNFVAHDSSVGILPASGDVLGGQASYQVQIDVPPGRNNVEPHVDFKYSSRSGNGVLGMGWSISTGSAISRCGKTLVHDGHTKGVEYTASEDRLCLDGQRLLLISGTYGSGGAVYRPEHDDFTRITAFGGINSNSSYFIAELKNNRVRYYGSESDSRHIPEGAPAPLSWAISLELDRTTAENSIAYQYQKYSDGEYLLSDIYYTGSGTSLGNRRVSFLYETRPDISSRYLSGGLTRQTKRLDKLVTYVGSTKVFEYRTTYKLSKASDRSLLIDLKKCGYEVSSFNCLEPVSFTWEDSVQEFALEPLGYLNSSGNIVKQLQDKREIEDVVPKGDANGDGVVDWRTWQTDAEGRFVSSKVDDLQTCSLNFINQEYQCVSGDFNQDGKTDSWRSKSSVLEISYAPSKWTSTSVPFSASSGEFVSNISDFNADGWPDLLIERGNHEQASVYLYLHTGNSTAPFIDNGKKIFTYEYNGDYRKSSMQVMGDMDGNGLPDFMVFNHFLQPSGLNISRQPLPIGIYLTKASSKGNVTFSLVDLDPYNYNQPFNFHYFMDVNGDGLQDWVAYREEGGLSLSLNMGAGRFSSWSALENSSGLIETRKTKYWDNDAAEWTRAVYAKYGGSFRQIDIDADGRTEILVPGTRLVSSCQKLQSFEGGSSLKWITVCGDDLYTKELDYSPDGGGVTQAINVDEFDDSVYQYNAIKFIEKSDGTYRTELVPTGIIGSATQTAVFDGFGNGLADLVFTYGCRNEWCSISGGSGAMAGKPFGVYVNRNRGSATGNERYEPTDMLVAVEDGLGARDEWHYRPLSSHDERYHSSAKPFYERGGYLDSLSSSVKEDHFEFTSSMYVVAEHRQSNGVGGLNKKQYRYKGAVFNNKGRGFQGFHTIIEEDLAADIETQSDFHQIFPLAGTLHKQRKWELEDRSSDNSSVEAFEESKFEWQFWPKDEHSSPKLVDALTDSWSVSANDPYFVGPKKQRSIHRTLNRSGNSRTHLYTQSQTTSFDAWGNVLLAENRYEEANSSHIVVSTTDTQYAAADKANWWINKPSKQTITKKSIQSRKGVSIAANTDTQQSVVVDFLLWDSNARKPKRVKTTPSSGKWTQVDTVYNNRGLPTKITTSAEGEAKTRVVETTAFSGDGYFPKTVKNVLGHTVTTETNAKFGQPDSITDGNGLTTRFSYDAFGRTTKVTAPSALGLKAAPDSFTALQWCNSGCSRAPGAVFKTIQQQAGMPEQVTYHDQLGRVIRTEVQAFDGSDWIARTVTYNALGQTTFESVPHYASSGTSYGTRYLDYDTFGRALHKTVNQTNGQQLDVTYTHEQDSGFTTDILVNGRTMSRTYNGLQQLTETVDALSGTTRYAYDGAGNPIVLRDASSNRITAKYNALGQKEWVDDPNMGSKSFTYTGFGEVETEIDGNLDITSFTYDRLGRMESRSVNGTEEASWKYDSAANGKGLLARESRSDTSYTRNYSYDALSRPYKVTTAIDGEDFVTQSHFDSNYGRLKGLSYPSGLTLQYGYNSSGYQFRTSNAASGYTYREITQMDAWGEWEFASVAAGNYTIGRSFYSETGQMAGTTFDSLVQNHQGIAYSYDSFGNLTEQVVQLPSKTPALNVENHYYDALNRLDYSTRTDGPNIDYDYDAIGNLLKKDDFASSYSYTGGSNGGPSAVKSVRLINGGTKTYSYDQNGNRTHENGTRQIWYNAFNKPTRINRKGANLYFYYGADQMRYKQVNQTSGKTTLYIDKLFEKITGGGETQYRHFIGDIAVLTSTDNGSELTHKIGFSHRDRLGSAAAVGDEAGNLKESHSFDPFGKPRQGNILDKDTPILESVYSTRGFTDHEHLDDVELIHMNGRAYDYNLGQFLSVDPVIQSPGNSQSLNPYSYIMNNPLAGTDPSGFIAEDEIKVEVKTEKIMESQTGSRIKRHVGNKISGSVTSGGVTTDFSMTVRDNGVFSGKITSTENGDSKSFSFSGDINNLSSREGGIDAQDYSVCKNVSCNNKMYGGMDSILHKESGASHSDWFAAAEHVTSWDGIGAIDNWNFGFITDSEESYLRFVHHSLAPINKDTFKSVRSGGLSGLSGKRLDDALVVKEQLLVSMFSSNYFSGRAELRGEVISGMNKSFDHNSYRSMYLPKRTNQVLRQQFGRGSFDLGDVGHRIKLGIGLVDSIREERGHQ
ncbi:RHS repeat-associated core domain-containing protein [Microbulbifer sp. JTAC008]|uniref:RHS repeat-associated core domain-containing protein n=1 Tax=Microbulbifer sp. JTAC008 TaxID=3243374 RepID=UPI00403A4C10